MAKQRPRKPKEDKTGRPDRGVEYHQPVMLEEALAGLNVIPNGVYADCTLGGGGHARAILNKLGPTGRLVLFDQDADARQNVPDDPRVLFIQENFRYLNRFLRLHQVGKLNGILADLGVSSHQFDTPERGFSFRFDARLDMRMNQRQALTAAHVLNEYPVQRLQEIFSIYGEVTNARTLAAAIASERTAVPWQSIRQFLEAIRPLSKGNPNRYFAQVFQALRIEVNAEMEALKEWLMQVPDALLPGGRVVVITFHSIEDRLVKTFFRQGSFQAQSDPVFGTQVQSPFTLLSKKPLQPTPNEVESNERSRSARMRIALRNEV
jgi:16S rRNA (cytosine1402-N4)-methyltransferase